MDIIRIELARLHNFFGFNNADFACSCYVWVEIASSLSENCVSESISLPDFNQ